MLVHLHEAGGAEDAQVLGHRRLRERQFVDDMAAHPRVLAGEHPQDPHADRVAEGFREGRELFVRGRVFHRSRQSAEHVRSFRGATGLGTRSGV